MIRRAHTASLRRLTMFLLEALGAGLATAALGATPPLSFDPELGKSDQLDDAATLFWDDLTRIYTSVTGAEPPVVETPILVAPAPPGLGSSESGASRLGIIELRAGRESARDATPDPRLLASLRHELTHQFLFAACPAASDDPLFHEAFALATSGELSDWTGERYLSTPEALRIVATSRSLDLPSTRRALARLLQESSQVGHDLPVSIERRLWLCAAGGRWAVPFTAEEAAGTAGDAADAFVVVSRHSGEVLTSEGAIGLPLPFGSVLKPFVVAGAGAASPPPVLAPRPRDAMWACGDKLPARVDVFEALWRSCNGYFLDWGRSDPTVARFGAFGPMLLALGLPRLPEEMSEAIGIRPALVLAPWAVAQAYRALAEAHPELIAALHQNATRGTLSELPASGALARFATKTGTVRDPRSRVRLGWIVAVDDDVVAVMVVAGQMPRSFADRLVRALARFEDRRSQGAASVQVFGLVPPVQVQARCDGVAVSVPEITVGAARSFRPLASYLGSKGALCLGAPWRVRLPSAVPTGAPPQDGREYAGVFVLAPLPPVHPTDDPADADTPDRARHARRGSDFIFRTTLARYTAGVLAAEDARITGDARAALLHVVAHNVAHSRHGARPVCDTTHCQAFLGTTAPAAADLTQLDSSKGLKGDWLLFARGGNEPWTENRTRAQVEKLLGSRPRDLRFAAKALSWRRTVAGQEAEGALYDEAATMPCETFRNKLKLPSCPEAATIEEDTFTFSGRGAGHGEGLDVEWAKTSGLSARQILEKVYGPAILRRD